MRFQTANNRYGFRGQSRHSIAERHVQSARARRESKRAYAFLRIIFFYRFSDSVCLLCYLSNSHLMAFSLPSLKLLIDVDFLPLSDLR